MWVFFSVCVFLNVIIIASYPYIHNSILWITSFQKKNKQKQRSITPSDCASCDPKTKIMFLVLISPRTCPSVRFSLEGKKRKLRMCGHSSCDVCIMESKRPFLSQLPPVRTWVRQLKLMYLQRGGNSVLRKADKECVCDNQKDAILALGCIILVYIYLGEK